MIVQTSSKDGMPAVAWEEKDTCSPSYGKAIGQGILAVICGGVTLVVAYVALGGPLGKYSQYSPYIALAVVAYFVWRAIREIKRQEREMVRGPAPGPKTGEYQMFRVLRISCAAFLTKDAKGELFLDVMKDGYLYNRVPMDQLRGFVLQSLSEYEGPQPGHWPNVNVIVADTGHGSSVLVAKHAGGRNELTQLLATLITTFIEGKPAAASRSAAMPMSPKGTSNVTVTWGTQTTARAKRNDLI